MGGLRRDASWIAALIVLAAAATGMWQMARFVSDTPLVIDYATAARFVPDPLPSFFDHSPGRDAGQGL